MVFKNYAENKFTKHAYEKSNGYKKKYLRSPCKILQQQLIYKKTPSPLWCLWCMTENAFLEISIQCLVILVARNVENVCHVILTLWKTSHQKKIRLDLIFLLQYPNSYSTLVSSIIQRHYCQPFVSKSSTKELSLHWISSL